MMITTLRRTLVPLLLATAASAQVQQPGSALFFPIHRSGDFFTLVSVTNTAPQKSVNATFKYVIAEKNVADGLHPTSCSSISAFESLTPSDTVTRLTQCQIGSGAKEGFLMVLAKDPWSGCNVSFDELVGSELVLGPLGSMYTLTPFAFQSPIADGACTDMDFDGRPDFDGVEYVAAPDELVLDSFIAIARSRLVLFHLSTDLTKDVVVNMNIYNDNEFPLSFTFNFRCWFEMPLDELSAVFTQNFLAGTPDTPSECDVNCDGLEDLETGWARIDAIVASNPFNSEVNPAILGAVTGGAGALEGGRLLWGRGTNVNGSL